jgi:hypothetical protein
VKLQAATPSLHAEFKFFVQLCFWHAALSPFSFETQYLNTNYFTFRSLFGHKFGLRNQLGDIKVFDLIFDLIVI